MPETSRLSHFSGSKDSLAKRQPVQHQVGKGPGNP